MTKEQLQKDLEFKEKQVKRIGLSQYATAKKIGVTPSYFSAFGNSRLMPQSVKDLLLKTN